LQVPFVDSIDGASAKGHMIQQTARRRQLCAHVLNGWLFMSEELTARRVFAIRV
jgi:hypothetical protein